MALVVADRRLIVGIRPMGSEAMAGRPRLERYASVLLSQNYLEKPRSAASLNTAARIYSHLESKLTQGVCFNHVQRQNMTLPLSNPSPPTSSSRTAI